MMEFILERYNYWIVIMLMMTGLYIVFSRGNLVKTLIGLNLFQTSVFIFYITIGKIVGGTAPILPYPPEAEHGEGGEHGEGHGAETAKHSISGAPDHDTQVASHSSVNDLNEVLATANSATDDEDSLHSRPDNLPEGAGANDQLAQTIGEVTLGGGDEDLHSAPEFESAATDASNHADVTGHTEIAHSGDASHAAETLGEVIYTNPLPHVLILTAIVVGVATTAVGLALAVRIREAYGTIEEDELEAKDHLAEFGKPLGAPLNESEGG